jgi:hypothetical protein
MTIPKPASKPQTSPLRPVLVALILATLAPLGARSLLANSFYHVWPRDPTTLDDPNGDGRFDTSSSSPAASPRLRSSSAEQIATEDSLGCSGYDACISNGI